MPRPLRDRYTTPKRLPRWRWWVGTVVILAMWFVGGTALSLVVLPFTGLDVEAFFIEGDVYGSFPSWGFLLFALVGFIPLLLGTLIAYRAILRVKLRRLFAVGVPFRLWRVIWGGVAWVLVMGTPTLVAVILAPEQYQASFSWQSFVPYAIIALTLLPVQTTAEEVFFRGWLLQWAGQRYSNIFLLSAISAIAFALPHLANPEAQGQILPAMFGYALVGFALAWVTIRDRSLEIAIGAHAANNLFAALVVGYEGGALPAEAPFVAQSIEWGGENFFTLLLVPLFILLSRIGYTPRQPRVQQTPTVDEN